MEYVLTFEGFYNIERDATNTNQNYFDDNPLWFGTDQTGSASKQVKVEYDTGEDPKSEEDLAQKLKKRKAERKRKRQQKAANQVLNFSQYWTQEFEPSKKPVLKRYK
jgi:2-methylcitrate dehydratase PrpD